MAPSVEDTLMKGLAFLVAGLARRMQLYFKPGKFTDNLPAPDTEAHPLRPRLVLGLFSLARLLIGPRLNSIREKERRRFP